MYNFQSSNGKVALTCDPCPFRQAALVVVSSGKLTDEEDPPF